MAVALDVVYQWLALPSIYPIESIVTATILAIIPYVALRGVTNRVARSRLARQAKQSGKLVTICLTAGMGIGLNDAMAQDKPKEPPELGWSNSTDLPLGRWGSWKVFVRYSPVDLDDRAVTGGVMDKSSIGLNWWATRLWTIGFDYGLTGLDRTGVYGLRCIARPMNRQG